MIEFCEDLKKTLKHLIDLKFDRRRFFTPPTIHLKNFLMISDFNYHDKKKGLEVWVYKKRGGRFNETCCDSLLRFGLLRKKVFFILTENGLL